MPKTTNGIATTPKATTGKSIIPLPCANLKAPKDDDFDGDATLTQSGTAYDLPAGYGEPEAGAPIYDERGVKIGHVPPTKDELYTLPGRSAFAHELPGQQPTLAAEPTSDGTLEVPAHIDADKGIPRAIDSDFALQPSPIVQELLESRRSSRLRLAITVFAGLLMVALAALIVAAFVIMMWYRDQVEPFADAIAALENYTPAYQTARIYAADGSLIAALNSQETGARTAVPLERVSPYMIHAIVSQENERFFRDPGFDPIAIARAFIQNVSGGGIESGASTITQQIARNLVLQDHAITVERKLKEILVALEIANRYDKSRVLELYLNEIFFANQTYGVEAAANFYFGHGADQLNFAESALLASIVPFPLQNDPVTNPDVAVAGMRSTMRKMVTVGCLQFLHDDWLSRGPFCITAGAIAPVAGGEAILFRTNDSWSNHRWRGYPANRRDRIGALPIGRGIRALSSFCRFRPYRCRGGIRRRRPLSAWHQHPYHLEPRPAGRGPSLAQQSNPYPDQPRNRH